ncbi:MAG: ATP-binding protein [Defluviitaleaceae bacterium]|nr:ATP-binding protein [Defluviitaleaceae bacterium]
MDSAIYIRPTTGVFATYKRLSYHPWTAIAEFVDNSTQSYFDHRDKLKSHPDFHRLQITIHYEQSDDGNDVLTITDNAFGMELGDFKRAFQLGKIPADTSGRNEFGMGLKTAACWFGSKWSVISSQLGSHQGYSATVDVERLAGHEDDSIGLDVFGSTPEEHYTIVRIEKLNQRMTGSRTIGKIRDLLSSIYRQDIRSGEISITYGDFELSFKEPNIFTEDLEDDSKHIWKKELAFTVPHDGIELQCHGFIALRIPASVSDAGFTLMRRGRVIVGGADKNYRPRELFGDSNSYEYQRLFGEIHMDNWPVTQAKDGFDWQNSGLEEKFIDTLQPLIKEYRQKANSLRVRQQTETGDVMAQAVKDLEQSGVIANASALPVVARVSEEVVAVTVDEVTPSIDAIEKSTCEIEETANSNDADAKIVGPENYNMTFSYLDKDFLFEIHFEASNARGQWINVVNKSEVHYRIIINLKHPFFKPFTENKEFFAIMTKLVIAMTLAEIEARFVSTDGKIEPSAVRRKMNDILEKIVTGG